MADNDQKKTNPNISTEKLKNEFGLTYEEYTAPIWEKASRPWNMELEDELIERVKNGEPIGQICKDKHMPSYGAWQRWFNGNVRFILQTEAERLRIRYAHAMDAYCQRILKEMVEIVDDDSQDTIKVTKFGKEVDTFNREWVQRSKLRYEARQWIVSKIAPHRYGDKVTVEHTGSIQHQQAPSFDMDNLTVEARGLLLKFVEQVELDKAEGRLSIDFEQESEVIDAEFTEIT